MSQIPENRTPNSTISEHVGDHNELARLHNLVDSMGTWVANFPAWNTAGITDPAATDGSNGWRAFNIRSQPGSGMASDHTVGVGDFGAEGGAYIDTYSTRNEYQGLGYYYAATENYVDSGSNHGNHKADSASVVGTDPSGLTSVFGYTVSSWSAHHVTINGSSVPNGQPHASLVNWGDTGMGLHIGQYPGQGIAPIMVQNSDGLTIFKVRPDGAIRGPSDGNLVLLGVGTAGHPGGVCISDEVGLNGTGNGVYFQTTGTDGEQYIQLLLGSTGQFSTLFNTDGTAQFPGPIKVVNGIFLESTDGTVQFTGSSKTTSITAVDSASNSLGTFGAQAIDSDTANASLFAHNDASTRIAALSVAVNNGGNSLVEINSDGHYWDFNGDGSALFSGEIHWPTVNDVSYRLAQGFGALGLQVTNLVNNDSMYFSVEGSQVSISPALGGNYSGNNWVFHVDGTTSFPGSIGVNGVTPPAQAAAPTTLQDVIDILTGVGFCAA